MISGLKEEKRGLGIKKKQDIKQDGVKDEGEEDKDK